jgi:PEP-CTERM motif
MNIKLRHFAACSAFVAISAVQAETITGTLTAGATDFGAFSDLSGSMNWTFSQQAVTALNADRVSVLVSSPGMMSAQMRPGTSVFVKLALDMPLTSLTGSYDGHELKMTDLGVLGAANSIQLATSDDALTSSGGSLVISNVHIDLDSKTISGDIVGGNGVGARSVALWGFENLSGPFSMIVQPGLMQVSNTYTGVHLLPAAAGVLAQSLGLLPAGQQVFASVSDYGTITSNVSVRAVPEASSWVLMGLGLMGISLARYIKRAA